MLRDVGNQLAAVVAADKHRREEEACDPFSTVISSIALQMASNADGRA